MDITKLMQEQADDAAELAKRTKAETVPQKVARFLAGQMDTPESEVLTREHGAEIDAEMARREEVARRKRGQEEKTALRIFDGLFSEKEEAAARRACWEFGQENCTIRSNVEYQLRLLEEVENRKQFITKPNLKSAFRDLVAQKVFVETIEPVQSAEAHRKEHAEDWPTPDVPPLILARIGKLLDTFSAANPPYVHSPENAAKMINGVLKSGAPLSSQLLEAVFKDLTARGQLTLSNAVQHGEVLRYTDMGGHAPGYPARPQKYSFRKKLDEMTADEVKQRILDDPNFETALNNLNR